MTLVLRDLKRPGPALHGVLAGLARRIGEDTANLADHPTVRIHDIRVSTKKIRSLLRLAGSQMAPEDRDALVEDLQFIKNTFSGTRDDDVMRLRLQQAFSAERAAKAMEKLGLARVEGPADFVAAPAASADLSSRLAALKLAGLTPELLVENAAASYRRARRLMRRCEKSPEDDRMHEWRKRVKDVCYHAMALSTLPAMEEFARPLDALAESLGEYHDLALLGRRAVDHQKIAARVSAAKHKVGRRCFKAAGSVFRQSPSRFAAKLLRMVLSSR